MNFRKVNNITGWIICAIACATYILTAEATASLWDTGEFIASAYKLQPPHPPGAPLFALLGRVFINIFGFGNPAFAMNIMSAVASGFTILFLFWTITHFGRKMFVAVGEDLTPNQVFITIAAGVIGALTFTFSDTIWFSAVEGEVYALSSFFTALCFWAMLKWEQADEHAVDAAGKMRADRWIVFIFFMMGLSIGVHLLNLLTIPAIVLIYYFRRYTYSLKGAIFAFIIGVLMLGFVQVVLIQWFVKAAGKFDVFFVNNMGMPLFTGFIIFFIIIGAAIWFGKKMATKNNWSFLRLALWCVTFTLLGYSTYFTTMIRSNANPAMDMNNVDNPMTLVSYLARDQYGSQPIVYGPHFAAKPKDDDMNGYYDTKEGAMKYTYRNGKYIETGKDFDLLYRDEDMMFFPRIWDNNNAQGHVDFYADWLGLGQYQNRQTGEVSYEKPSYSMNVNWFFSYQMGLMYWRYFMWNFSGKQNDLQAMGNKMHGNWISGISFIDNQRLGDQSKLPDSIKDTKATNKLFMLPFILGIVGCMFQFFRNRRDWIPAFWLFFITGIGIGIYLNMAGPQPRERDYAFVGSFYAYAIWIGLSIVAFVKMARERDDEGKKRFTNVLIWGGALTFLVALMSSAPGSGGSMLATALFSTALYVAFTFALTFILRAVSSKGTNERIMNIVASLVGMLVVLIMVSQEWNDHDRSKKTIAPDNARNYLESCAPNAILFTFGDNDTYPLWYAQEVENVRPDIRIINTSLLGIDWYINQLRYKVNESDSIDVIWNEEQIQGSNRQYLQYYPTSSVSPQTYYPLYSVMKTILGSGNDLRTFPIKKFKVPVDTAMVRKNGTVNATDTVYNEIQFEVPGNGLGRDQLIILNIIATNNWRRPIYFTNPYGELGFGQFLRKDGLTYRLVPVKLQYPQFNWMVDEELRNQRMGTSGIRDNNLDWMYNILMTKFKTGNAQTPGIYFDEENRRHLQIIRSTFAELAGNMADAGRKEEAKKLFEKAESLISPENMPYAMPARLNNYNSTHLVYLEGIYKTGNMPELAEKVRAALKKDLDQQKAFYNYLKAEKEDAYETMRLEDDVCNRMLNIYNRIVQTYDPGKLDKTAIPPAPNPTQVPVLPDTTKKDKTAADTANK